MWHRRYYLVIAGVIVTSLIPLAIAQEYFRYNPYILPILGLIATGLFLAFFLTGQYWRNFYHNHCKIGNGFLIFIIILIIIADVLWIRGSINHVAELKLKDAQTKAFLSTYFPIEIKGLSKEEIELLVKKLVDENIKKIRNETSQVRYTLPQLGEEAVLKVPLYERPTLDLTDKEIRLIFKVSKSATKKILVNQIEWRAYADIADTVKEGHEDYERSLFGGEKTK